MPNNLTTTILVAVAVLSASPMSGQDAVACKQMDEVLAELRELRKLIENRPIPPAQLQPTSARLEVGDAPLLGSKDAPLTIVEFADYQCPYCQRFYKETFPDLKKAYIDSGKVRFYVMNLPLIDKHKNSLLAAQAAQCAGEQGQFWQMHGRMAVTPEFLEMTNLIGNAAKLGMDLNAFSQCVESGKFKDAIQRGVAAAQAQGVRGTPSFVIGKSTANGVAGEIVVGALPLAVFEKKLQDAAK